MTEKRKKRVVRDSYECRIILRKMADLWYHVAPSFPLDPNKFKKGDLIKVTVERIEAMGGEGATMSIEDSLADISIRCPDCRGTNLTSDNKGNHRCLDCGHRCSDKTALPSIAKVRQGPIWIKRSKP